MKQIRFSQRPLGRWLTLLFILSFIGSSAATAEDMPPIKVLFSPQDNCAREIVSEIDSAKKQVWAAMYFFTSRPIAQALVRAKDRGVDVRVCMDVGQRTSKYSKSRFLANKGINGRLVGTAGIMHNKFCLIDDYVTITGSYNWTAAADLKNDENLLIIRSEDIATIFREEFERLWNGQKIDAYKYKDKTRLEKIPETGFITVTPLVAKSGAEAAYVASKNSKKFHRPGCRWAVKIKPDNKIEFSTRQDVLDKGYTPCKVCKP